MQDNSFEITDEFVIGIPIAEISQEFSHFLSVIIGKWLAVRLLQLHHNVDVTIIDDEIVNRVGGELAEELCLSIKERFTDKLIQLDLLMDHIEQWTPDFFVASQLSKLELH